MNLLILLDFDGVLFNSAYEAYQVCERLAKHKQELRQKVNLDEFMDFRRYVTDAWQFNRLYSKSLFLDDFSKLPSCDQLDEDQDFANSFFNQRKEIMQNKDWVKLMSPFPFFYEIKKLIDLYPNLFKILSTRDELSIRKTLDFFSIPQIEIFGKESLSNYDSKIDLANKQGWMDQEVFSVFVDDMNYHLEPFQGYASLCIHAGWGYDFSSYESYSQTQVFRILSSLVSISKDVKLD